MADTMKQEVNHTTQPLTATGRWVSNCLRGSHDFTEPRAELCTTERQSEKKEKWKTLDTAEPTIPRFHTHAVTKAVQGKARR